MSEIDPALGLPLTAERTLIKRQDASVTVLIPAHNEEATIAEVVRDSFAGIAKLDVHGNVLVSASGCTDRTAEIAEQAGAHVITSPTGKGAALNAGLQQTDGDIVCLIDGDLQYFGDKPLVTLLVEPILSGIADATISDLYWRPLYPQLWLHGFFAPLAGWLFPEILPKVGSTPWTGQRAAIRPLWPNGLPEGFTVDLALLMHWNRNATRMRPVLADDWTNPQRPKPELMSNELDLIAQTAVAENRITQDQLPAISKWFSRVHALMAKYQPEHDDPTTFEQQILRDSSALLERSARNTPG